MKQAKSREEMLASLTDNMPEILPPLIDGEEYVSSKPSEDSRIKDSEEDFKFTRDRMKKLIENTDEAVGRMLELASDSEHPRAYEVLANLIKTAAEVNKQLLDNHEIRKKTNTPPATKKGDVQMIENNSTTNQAIFVGTTADLQKFLSNRDKESLINNNNESDT